MIRQVALFLVGSSAGAVALASIYYLREGLYGVAKVGVAASVCIVPGLIALAWVIWARKQVPSQQLLATMGGMLVRMAGALGGGLLAYRSVPEFRLNREGTLSFWAAILICYLGTLALETILTARSPSRLSPERHR